MKILHHQPDVPRTKRIALEGRQAADFRFAPHDFPGLHRLKAGYGIDQRTFQAGIDEGARLVAGGLGHPKGFDAGNFVRPTIFADVRNDMTIAREEIFGPVLVIIPFDDEQEAIAIANDTPYGLSAYVQTGSVERAKRLGRKLRAGMVQINGSSLGSGSPFGGYKQSGNGREGGKWGFEDFTEVKVITG